MRGWDGRTGRPLAGSARPGVSAWVEHLPGGVSWAVLFNTSADKEGEGTALAAARQRIPEAISKVKVWPGRDLFQ